MKTKSIARFSLLCAMALVLGYFERFIPVAPGIPGVKLGLANTVLLYAVYLMGAKSAMLLMLAKVVLSGFLFAGLSGMLYSLAGGLLSLCVMLLLSRLKDVGIIGVSVGGAVSHNIGQIAVACMVVESRAVLGYLPVLMISAVITGTLTGIAAKYAIAALQKAGLPLNKDYIFTMATTIDGAYENMKRYLSEKVKLPTAFFADNDMIALGAMPSRLCRLFL